MIRYRLMLAISLLLLLTETNAKVLEPVPEKLVQCTVCHGTQLMGNPGTQAPRLSGMSDWYVKKQLEAFRQGWRGTHPEDFSGAEMMPIAKSLSTELIAEAIRFIKQTSAPSPRATISADINRGKQWYTSCGACHGANAEGNEALGAPALKGLNDWYMLTQLKNFKAGVRGGNPKDPQALLMTNAAKILPDEQAMAEVVAYITQLQSTTKEN